MNRHLLYVRSSGYYTGYYPLVERFAPRLARTLPFAGTYRRSRGRALALSVARAVAAIREEDPQARVDLVADPRALDACASVEGITGGMTPDATPGRGGADAHLLSVWVVYPDALGLGSLGLDLRALRAEAAGRWIYNGRDRRLPLTPRALAALTLRRAVIKTWAVEAAATFAFVVGLPFLAAAALWDLIRNGSRQETPT